MNLKILFRIVVILLRLGIFTFPGCKLCSNYRRIKLHKQRKNLWKENRIFIVDCLSSLSNVQLGKEFSKLSNERAGRAEKMFLFCSLNQLFLTLFGLQLIIFTVPKEKQLI